ncbi:hypothetical protein ACH5RR_001398 [Cinchona calisaya]|uniref:NB-ARC domain-containing protein n=1 Tax=Cinchona calisaya TaxID=153742 RepID=A0ABD3B4H4_9GENT
MVHIILIQNLLVPFNFHIHARCCVTQAYQIRRLLLEILQEVSRKNKQRHGITVDELAEKLYKSLKGKKYHIFFDDLWDIRQRNDFSASFLDNNLGSRIIFTSQFHSIASQIESRSITYPLNLYYQMLQVGSYCK